MDKYHLRRAVLDALLAAEPAPLTVDELCGYPPLQMSATPRETLVAELRGLVDHGYVRDLRPGREPLFRIAADGRDQARREVALAEYVWGEWALQ